MRRLKANSGTEEEMILKFVVAKYVMLPFHSTLLRSLGQVAGAMLAPLENRSLDGGPAGYPRSR